MGVLSLSLVLTTNSHAAGDWYYVKVTQLITGVNGGNVVVVFDPGATETKFTTWGRGLLPGSEKGSNKMMAMFLTAASLKAEIKIFLDSVPNKADIPIITNAGLIVP